MTTDDVTVNDVLHFWFGKPGSNPLANAEAWWKKDAAFDAELTRRFGPALERAALGELDAWKATPRGRLALILLLDQMSRNIYRGTPRSFAQDPKALELALEGLTNEDERELSPVETQFLLMPLMHAENTELQHECVARFERLRDEGPQSLRAFFDNALSFARAHAVIIDRFGRFPHRNAILDRKSTAEETEFLKQPNSSF